MATVQGAALAELLVDAGDVNAVIVYKLWRLTPAVRDLGELLDRFDRHGVSLVSVSESLGTETASGPLVLEVMASVGQCKEHPGRAGRQDRAALRAGEPADRSSHPPVDASLYLPSCLGHPRNRHVRTMEAGRDRTSGFINQTSTTSMMGQSKPDSQVVELLGLHRLADELLMAGLEVAYPARDRGIDLVAYLDLDDKARRFIACPIQMKASSLRGFGLDRKYEKFSGLILAFVWNLRSGEKVQTFALTYREAFGVAEVMGWTKTDSWIDRGRYVTSRPAARLRGLLEPYRMGSERWYRKVVDIAAEIRSSTTVG